MSLARPVGAALTTVHPGVTFAAEPLTTVIEGSLAQERILATLSGVFGLLALLLAALGLYGRVSYSASRRRTEIGIRLALGTAPRAIVRHVLSRVTILISIGVILGALISLWASRYIATLLYGLEPADLGTLVAAGTLLGAVGAVAGWIPARRASRIDPAEVLRNN
jgi:ABC-type antimicrobial peptide transport system permease subunit